MTDHVKHIDQIIKSIRQVVSDIVEDSRQDRGLMNAGWTICEARRSLEKAKRQLEELEKNET